MLKMVLSKFDSKVIEINKLSSDVKLIRFSVPETFTFKPGQYVSIVIQLENERIKRSYSIASPPKNNFLDICIKNVGVGSDFLCNSKIEDKFTLIGPLGGFTLKSEDKDLVLISSGTGISPYLSIIPSLFENGFKKKIFLLAGFRNEEDLLYQKELNEFSKKYPNFSFHYVLSQPKNKLTSLVGHVQDFLENQIPRNFNGDYYICGLLDMINDTIKKLEEMKVSKERIFYEKYD